MRKTSLLTFFIVFLIFLNMGKLHSQEKEKILVDEYYATWKPSKHLMDIESELERRGYSIEYSSEWMNSLSLSEYDALVFFIPFKYFHDEEKNAIKEFVKDGGGLIIFGDHGGYMDYRDINDSVNSISTMFGIEFNEDVVRDEEKNREDIECQVILDTFASHPVTKGIDEMGYICGCSLTLRSSVTALAYGNKTTTADGKKGRDVVVLAAAEYGKGKVLAVGDSDFLVGASAPGYEEYDFLSYKDNKTLALNMFEWVISPKTEEAERLASEGHALYSQKEYSTAKLKFKEALAIYSEVNDTQKISEMQTMINKCEKGASAESAYEKGMAYYTNEDYEKAQQEFETSRSLYDQIGDSTRSNEAQKMIDECERVLNATAAYEKGEEYYTIGDYESAKAEFQRSESLYNEIGDSEKCENVQEMIDLCDKYINAQNTYGEGTEYYNDKKFKEAIATFEEAILLYQELGDSEKTEELQTTIDEVEEARKEAQEARDRQAPKNKMMIFFGILIVVAVVFLMVLVFLRKPEVTKPSGPLPGKTVYCPECGKENPEDASHCESCGTPLKSIDELEKEKAIQTLRKKFAKGEISEEEFHETMEELKKGL